MTHLCVHEWGRVAVGDSGFSRAQANTLLAAARIHTAGGQEGTAIIVDHHKHLTAQQVVGVLAAKGCSLEILPKVDPTATGDKAQTVRSGLIHMLDVALGLNLSTGPAMAIARQDETLLDILIRLFAGHLLIEVRRGLPRHYSAHREDLHTLRGRLDVLRQFTIHAVRPDRLACRFDTLETDTPLMRIMKACVTSLAKHARHLDTQRKLADVRFLLADIPDVAVSSLPWKQVRIDRSNRQWQRLMKLAELFLRRKWQATHHESKGGDGVSLLFPMNDLFEAYVAAQLRKSFAGSGIKVIEQGGLRYCLGDWRDGETCSAHLFRTKPDIILRSHEGQVVAIIDTKWKRLSADPLSRKHGVVQSDVYQMMAYARLYECDRLMLLYPASPGNGSDVRRTFGIAGGQERLSIATVDLANQEDVPAHLMQLVHTVCERVAPSCVPIAG